MMNKEKLFSVNDYDVCAEQLLSIIRKNKMLISIAREVILENILSSIKIGQNREKEIIKEFKLTRNFDSEEELQAFLNKEHLNEKLLVDILTRGEKMVIFREDKWKHHVKELYLKHKEKYDKIKFLQLTGNDFDTMQEVYFRLKDKEETWIELANQFYPDNNNKAPLIGPVSVEQLNNELLKKLKEKGPEIITGPIKVDNNYVVVELKEVIPSILDEKLENVIMQDEFNSWIEEKIAKYITNLNFY